jgi:hypothetical protein
MGTQRGSGRPWDMRATPTDNRGGHYDRHDGPSEGHDGFAREAAVRRVGCRVRGPIAVGDTITIAARSGKSWQATVTEIVREGDPALVATVGADRAPTTPRRGAVGTCDECGYHRTDLWPATDITNAGPSPRLA